ncbi:unnamed protein product [Lathyrus oleraceus]
MHFVLHQIPPNVQLFIYFLSPAPTSTHICFCFSSVILLHLLHIKLLCYNFTMFANLLTKYWFYFIASSCLDDGANYYSRKKGLYFGYGKTKPS